MSEPAPDEDPDGEPSFTTAMAELATIVGELESDAVDVDDLADRVARAAVLVSWCRQRIDGARYQVEQVLVQLDPSQTEAENDAK